MALTREISDAIQQCVLTHLPRTPIDLLRARSQHSAYEWALVDAGCTVRRLDTTDPLPDSVFIEDTAIVLDELAIITRPGAQARRSETPAVAQWLTRVRTVRQIETPGTIDGGDVLTVGRTLYVGVSERTNDAGTAQLRSLVGPYGYKVEQVPVTGCLHLKSAVTLVAEGTLLINRSWVPADAFAGCTLIDIDPDEPHAANAVAVGGRVIYPSTFPLTRRRLEDHRLAVYTVHMDELAKAEGAVTCCSLIFNM